jgi:hypothetical protein
LLKGLRKIFFGAEQPAWAITVDGDDIIIKAAKAGQTMEHLKAQGIIPKLQ